ncbi:MAG: BolA family transcriptional regulator [Proteobacteria bacterium]|nr:BolA family transcriptional regulator [Pseudomonadota bacterium]
MNLEPVLRARLAALSPESLEITDDSAAHAGHAGAAPGGNTHWSVAIVSRAFEGKPTIARHRMVYAALGELMDNPIHALQIRALVPGEA